jgi:hypothetical protein
MLMAGGPTVLDRRMLPGLLTLLIGLLAMSGFGEWSVARFAGGADGRAREECQAWCFVDPSGIRWDEASVDHLPGRPSAQALIAVQA